MEFRRITGLPPYVLAEMDALKLRARRAGEDVIDLAFGNPDIPSPDIAVEKLAEAARNPHNPTTTCVDLPWMKRLVDFARDRDVVLVHDFAYSDTAFDGYRPPSILEVPGAKEVAVELYTLTKSFSMAGWRVGFLVGNAAIVAALTKLKSYLDYGTFQPIQIAAIVTMNEAADYPKVVNEIYQSRRDALCDGLSRMGWEVAKPRGTMFVWAPIPAAYREMGPLEFAKFLVTEGKVAVAPGVGFGPGGDGHVRFALIENEQRIGQAVRSLRKVLTKL